MPTYNLPDGTTTNDAAESYRAWREFGRPLGEALGAPMCAFDPGVEYSFRGRPLYFATDVVRALNEALAKRPPEEAPRDPQPDPEKEPARAYSDAAAGFPVC